MFSLRDQSFLVCPILQLHPAQLGTGHMASMSTPHRPPSTARYRTHGLNVHSSQATQHCQVQDTWTQCPLLTGHPALLGTGHMASMSTPHRPPSCARYRTHGLNVHSSQATQHCQVQDTWTQCPLLTGHPALLGTGHMDSMSTPHRPPSTARYRTHGLNVHSSQATQLCQVQDTWTQCPLLTGHPAVLGTGHMDSMSTPHRPPSTARYRTHGLNVHSSQATQHCQVQDTWPQCPLLTGHPARLGTGHMASMSTPHRPPSTARYRTHGLNVHSSQATQHGQVQDTWTQCPLLTGHPALLGTGHMASMSTPHRPPSTARYRTHGLNVHSSQATQHGQVQDTWPQCPLLTGHPALLGTGHMDSMSTPHRPPSTARYRAHGLNVHSSQATQHGQVQDAWTQCPLLTGHPALLGTGHMDSMSTPHRPPSTARYRTHGLNVHSSQATQHCQVQDTWPQCPLLTGHPALLGTGHMASMSTPHRPPSTARYRTHGLNVHSSQATQHCQVQGTWTQCPLLTGHPARLGTGHMDSMFTPHRPPSTARYRTHGLNVHSSQAIQHCQVQDTWPQCPLLAGHPVLLGTGHMDSMSTPRRPPSTARYRTHGLNVHSSQATQHCQVQGTWTQCPLLTGHPARLGTGHMDSMSTPHRPPSTARYRTHGLNVHSSQATQLCQVQDTWTQCPLLTGHPALLGTGHMDSMSTPHRPPSTARYRTHGLNVHSSQATQHCQVQDSWTQCPLLTGHPALLGTGHMDSMSTPHRPPSTARYRTHGLNVHSSQATQLCQVQDTWTQCPLLAGHPALLGTGHMDSMSTPHMFTPTSSRV